MPKLAASIKLIVWGLIWLIAAGCEKAAQEPTKPAESRQAGRSVEAIADEYLAAMLQRYPETATYYSLPGARHDDLTDNSMGALAAWQTREDAWLRELGEIGAPTDIGSRDWVTYGILRGRLASAVDRRICRDELWRASGITAWHTSLPFVFDLQPLDADEQREQALQRLGKVARYIETETRNLREGLELGYSAPRVTVAPVPDEIRALLGDNNPFIGMTRRSDDSDFVSAVRRIFADEVTPAIERFARFVDEEYLPAARDEIAVSANPDGAACYPALVRYYTTISPTADEIHELGLQQVGKIRAEMRVVLDQYFDGAAIETFLQNLNIDPRYTFRSEADVLQYSLDALDDARDAMPRMFGLLPKADVLIKPYPAYRESGTGEYHSSSEDGTRPGIYYIAVVRPENRSRAIQQSVLFHETYPGHHLQGAIALELGDRVHPLARYLWNAGYGEGWGLYSERLADELGLYGGPLDRMGMLADQAARAARLVVDTGLHTRGWTRQQAVDYMLANSAWPPGDIESEVNRYISLPGQANAYMLGMLEIRRLRALAEARLGEIFDIRQFHDRVLENGMIPLPMLDASVMTWIEGNR